MTQVLNTRSNSVSHSDSDVTEDHVITCLTAAFEADPPVRWMYPNRADYLAHFPTFLRAFGGVAMREGTLEMGEGGAALWVAPGSEPDGEAIMAAVEYSVPARRHQDIFAVFDAMGGYHPAEPCWYLPVMGVVPERQVQGIGAAMVRPVLDRCDAMGVPAYLEATTERSRALYARHGFETVGTICVADCPPIHPMLRHPR